MSEPVRPPTYPLTEMEPSWFEQLCWRLLLIEFPGVRFIENPDGGVDAILTSPDGTKWVRAWQAKRFTEHVKWGECERSYDAALASYHVSHLTFCFARDLTGKQEQTFVKRLGRRTAGVVCDWVGRGEIHRWLTETSQGQATAEFFFKRETVDLATLDRALKVGRVIESTGQAVDHLAELGKFLGTHDPYFEVESSNFPVGRDRGPAPGTVMSLLRQADGRVTRLDIQPTDSESLRLYGPEIEIGFTDDEHGERAQRILEEALAGRRSAFVKDGLRVRFTRCPPVVRQELSEEFLPASLEVTLADLERAWVEEEPALPTPSWGGELSIEGRPELGSLPIAIAPASPPDGWDICLSGEREGFELRFMSREREGRRETGFELGYALTASRPKDQATVVRLMRAMAAGEVLVLEDGEGERRPIEVGPSVLQQFPDEQQRLLKLYDDLIAIEELTGREFAVPDSVSGYTLGQARQVADALRRRELHTRLRELEYQADDAESLAKFIVGGQRTRVEGIVFDVLGEEFVLDGSMTMPALRIVSTENTGDGKILAKLLPRDRRRSAVVKLDVPGAESHPAVTSS